jgi:hypothetical protein
MAKLPVSHAVLAAGTIAVASCVVTGALSARAQTQPFTRAIVASTEAALRDQLSCEHDPEVARAINAMHANHLIKYVAEENAVYLFEPTTEMKFLGFKIIHISGAEYGEFKGVPGSTMAGTAPPVFIEIDVAASVDELRSRASEAGLLHKGENYKNPGLEISAQGYASYLVRKNRAATSSVTCVQGRLDH